MAGSRRKKTKDVHVNLERWMISYADFLTLLFAVFVMLYAMSQVDIIKIKIVAESLQQAFGQIPAAANDILTHPTTGSQGEPLIVPPIVPLQQPLYEEEMKKVEKDVKKALKEEKIEEAVQVRKEPRGLIISLKDTRFFDTGVAQLRPAIVESLKRVVITLKGLNDDLRIEGHTDNVPINTVEFPSNWELSASRAMTVLRFVRYNINFPPDRLSLAGYGEFRPVASNATDQGRARNRRVDIVILNPDYKKYEPMKQ